MWMWVKNMAPPKWVASPGEGKGLKPAVHILGVNFDPFPDAREVFPAMSLQKLRSVAQLSSLLEDKKMDSPSSLAPFQPPASQ